MCYNIQTTNLRTSFPETREEMQRERKYIDMIKLLVGVKGTGKTKTLIAAANEALESSKGYVVCIEKGATLRHEISYKVRLVNTDDYLIEGGVALGGMVAGILAGNADVTDLFIDGTRKIFGYDKADMALFLADLEKFIADLEKVIRDANVNVTITVSVDPADLPESLKKYL